RILRFRKESLDRLHVRGLCALGALHDLELDLLTLGQRLVSVHRDRREVDKDVLATLTLDEPIALLVREPLDGALSQLRASFKNMRRPGHRAATTVRTRGSVAQTRGKARAPRRYFAARTAFPKRQAIVIGPTPPGTGVQKAATSATDGSTSPTNPASVRVIPTSTTAAPCLTMSAVTTPGRPTATT